MKKNKFLLFSPMVLGFASLVTLISCGQSDKISEQKDIYVAVDGVQTKFYEKAIELFNKTESYNKGFRIKTINKDVWAALDFTVQGLDDKSVPDIFYAPQDRLTDFMQKNALADINTFSPNLFNDIATKLSLSQQQKEDMREFGNVKAISKDGLDEVTKFVGLRHNKEGIVIASNKSEEETREVFKNPSTDTLKELVEKGETVLRLQDLWYGNGIFYGGMEAYWNSLTPSQKEAYGKNLDKYLASKILYLSSDEANKVSSGFIKGDKFHEIYKKGLEAVVDVLWPVIDAAYIMDESKFSKTVWFKKGITQSDLQSLYVKDMGNVYASAMKLMKENKISYSLIGTWDVQNSEIAGGAKSFFNVIKVNENAQYKQAPGSWSYMINSRNNGASKDRKDAISQFLKIVFEIDPYYEYFKSDSKVPYSQHRQDQVKEKILEDNKQAFDSIHKLATDLGYADAKELQNATNTFLKPLIEFMNTGVFWPSWETPKNLNNPDADDNLTPTSEMNIDPTKRASFIKAEKYDQLASQMKPTLALRNTIAVLLGLKDNWSTQLVGNGESWQIGASKMKDNAFAKLSEQYKDQIVQQQPKDNLEGTFHIRKVEKIIFGANGDNKTTDVVELLKQISEAITNNTLDKLIADVVARAKEFSKETAKVAVSDQEIEKAAKLYFQNYINAARITKLVQDELQNNNMPKKNGTPSNYKGQVVINKLEQYDKLLSFDKILNVITSTKTLDQGGVGILQTQPSRFDSSNPRFAFVWGRWNDQVLGNVEWYKQLKSQNVNSAQTFLNVLENKFSEVFTEFANSLKDGASVSVKLSE